MGLYHVTQENRLTEQNEGSKKKFNDQIGKIHSIHYILAYLPTTIIVSVSLISCITLIRSINMPRQYLDNNSDLREL